MFEEKEKITFIDLETAGLEFTRPIIQIAAIAVDSNLNELESLEFKIQFDEAEADSKALSANKYSPELWRETAIPAVEAAQLLAELFRRHATVDLFSRHGRAYQVTQLAAHNGESFDGPFLHAWYRRMRIFCPARYITLCTKQRALWLFEEDKTLTPPADFKLLTLCQYFGINLRQQDAHDAMADVRATVKLYREIRRRESIIVSRAA